MVKITIKDCEKYAKIKNGKCLSKIYVNIYTKMDWVCEKEHYFSTIFKSVKKGHWCLECSGYKKLTQDFVEKQIADKNGKLLSKYINSGEKLKIRCLKDNHVWWTPWDRIKQNHWCPKCSGSILLTNKELNKFIENKNGSIISSDNFSSARSKITIQCLKDNHIWDTTWDYLKQGNWCPKCAGKILKTYDEFNEFMYNKNGKILNCPKTFNHKTKFKIQCLKDNYKWKTSYYALVYHGTWCPKCAGKILKSFKEVKDFVKNKNGKMLSNKRDLKCNTSKLTVQCRNKHVWDISYKNLLNNNRWCPYCKSFIAQKKLLSMVSEILNVKCILNFRGFDWLKDKRNMELDIWAPDIKLAIEYDGPHHFRPICYNNDKQKAEEKFKDRIRKDKLKDDLIKKHKDIVKYFIRVGYKEKIEKEYIIKKLQNAGIKI